MHLDPDGQEDGGILSQSNQVSQGMDVTVNMICTSKHKNLTIRENFLQRECWEATLR